MRDVDGIDGFDGKVEALETSLGGASEMAGAFDNELRAMRATIADTGREVNTLSRGISRGLRRAFDDLVFDGDKLSDVLKELGNSIQNATLNAAIKPVTNHFGGVLGTGIESIIQGLVPFAKGGAFSQGKVTPFATGGVVSGPTMFPMRGGMGLMGEAGPEAIMPLTRGANGKLGVQAAGSGRAVNVVMNISTPDATSFQRSQGQIAAQVNRALSRANRNR